jgi:hypothetical protein
MCAASELFGYLSARSSTRCIQSPLECFWSPGSPIKEFTRLGYTGLVVELEHLKIETRLIDEKFANTMGEYVT